MRKNILTVLTFVFVSLLTLTGCGSTSNSGGTTTGSIVAVEMQTNQIVVTGTDFTLDLPFTKKLDNTFLVELSNFDLIVSGCDVVGPIVYTPATTLVLNGDLDTQEILNISGSFDQNCTPAGYTFNTTQTVTKDGEVDTRMFSVTYDTNSPDGGDVTPAPSNGFFNATTPLEITQVDQPYEIKVQMIGNGYVASGKTVQLKPFDSQYGSVDNYSATTGADGYAVFNYTSPSILPANGTSTLLELTNDENGTIITQNIVLEFNFIDPIPSPLVLPYVVIPDDKKENNLTFNSQLIELPIKVFNSQTNAPYSDGKVKVELPDKVTAGVDVGTFEAYEVDIVNGIAVFKYSGPTDLKRLIDSGDTESLFGFYHEDNYMNKQLVKMIYNPDSNYIPSNYVMTFSSDDSKFTMGLLSEKTFSVILKDDQGAEVSDTDITSTQITSKNTVIGKLLDNGVETTILTVLKSNPVNFIMKTGEKSGLLPIEVSINFVDANGEAKVMTQTFNIVVFSGPPTAMSISYVGVSQDIERAKYTEKFAVTVVDTYNNQVNTQPNISIGGIVEYAVDGSSLDGVRDETSPRLWYGKFDTPHGTVTQIGGNEATFDTPVGLDKFQYVDFFNDKLVVFGEGYVYEALGKWDISTGATLDSLTLIDDYFGITRDNLFYAVGHNYRLDLCADDGREYVGSAKSDTYQVDKEGTALVEFEYDYHLTGKDIMLWVNLSGYQADTGLRTRIGEARAHTLRGNGLVTPNTYTLPPGTSGAQLHFDIAHENASERYKNGHFSFTVTGTCSVNNVIDSSNFHYDTNGVALAVKDARACDNGGVAYVQLNVSNPSGSNCTISLDNIVVSDEF